MKTTIFRLCVLIHLLLILPCFAGEDERAFGNSGEIINTSICELVADPQRFNGRIVQVRAQYESDGLGLRTLVDPRCRGGVLPSGGVQDPLVGGSLSEALRHGCAGTRDKQITATWVGEYHWQPENTPGTRRAPRWLDVQKIEGLEVKSRPGAFSFPDR
jgi:hypothetical protein